MTKYLMLFAIVAATIFLALTMERISLLVALTIISIAGIALVIKSLTIDE
jgi:hypothetical protein